MLRLLCTNKSWFIPAEYSYNGEERELHTADHVVSVFDKYIGWLKEKGVGKSNLHTYSQLNPNMKLFVSANLRKCLTACFHALIKE